MATKKKHGLLTSVFSTKSLGYMETEGGMPGDPLEIGGFHNSSE